MSLREASSGERKLENYYGCYDRHFPVWKDKVFNLLEIGVQHGGSIRMWQKYFPEAKITGIDIDAHCKELDLEGANIEIGDQSDPEFLKSVDRTYGPFDIIIDDGGHTMNQQQESFKTLYPILKNGGIYVIEDLHTSYWEEFQDAPVTTINFLKNLLDDVNRDALFSPRASKKPSESFYPIREIHFYPSITFIFK